MKASTAANALGWITIGLSLTELVAPGWLEKRLGANSYQRLTGIFNLRDLRIAPNQWARVAGDSIDLVSLATAAQNRIRSGGVGTALIALAAMTAMDALAASGVAEEIKEKITQKTSGKAEKRSGKTARATATREEGRISKATH